MSGGTVLLLACALTAVALLALAARIQHFRRRAPSLPDPDRADLERADPSRARASSTPPPEVAVLLPVRNEEGHVLGCLRTLLNQTVLPRVVVVDDHSEDATRALAEERAADEPRLQVTRARSLPSGWGGKVHALHCGLRFLHEEEARTAPAASVDRWVLSTDADTRHHPRLLERALAAARAWDLDAVSVAGHQEVRGLAENLLTPPVFALLDGELGDWRPAARGEGPPVANGQFLLLRRSVLEGAGGFEAVRDVAIDDVGLVRAMRLAGGRTGFVRAPDLLRVRMYQGLGPVYRGWRRNLGGLFGERPGRAALALTALAVPPLLLLATLVGGLVALAAGSGASMLAGAAALWAGGAAASAWLRAGSGHGAGWGLLYPLDALFLALTLGLGVVDWRRGALRAWKGRRVEAR